MTPTRVIAIGGDSALSSALEELVQATRSCYFAAVEADDLADSLDAHGAGLAILCCGPVLSPDRALALTGELMSRSPAIPAVVVAENHSPEQMLAFLQRGAVDCLPRPLNLARVAFLIDVLTIRARLLPVQSPVAARAGAVFRSQAMQRLMEQIVHAARVDATVLFTGETGTGKTHMSRVLHDLSARRGKPFLAVNCGALNTSLIESELFGHARGAFTGADSEHVGKLAQAADGTLLLDEIDTLPLDAQTRLLRAVEEREFQPVGSVRMQRFAARLIVAANRPLEDEVTAGRFRSDLYYRVNVLALRTPSLRERREDVESLLEQFLRNCGSNETRLRGFSRGALHALTSYDWPGNIRELRNVVERLTAMCPGRFIEWGDLPAEIRQNTMPASPHVAAENQLAKARTSAEQARLVETLRRNNNNRSVTAAELGISRTALYKKLKKYAIA